MTEDEIYKALGMQRLVDYPATKYYKSGAGQTTAMLISALAEASEEKRVFIVFSNVHLWKFNEDKLREYCSILKIDTKLLHCTTLMPRHKFRGIHDSVYLDHFTQENYAVEVRLLLEESFNNIKAPYA